MGTIALGILVFLITSLIGLIVELCLGFVSKLLGNFFYDAFAVETNFYDMVNSGSFNITSLYHAIYIFAISLLIMLFVKKMIETYFAWSNGDPDNSPFQVLIGFVEALIIMISFGFLYETFVNVMYGLYESITTSAFGSLSDIDSMVGQLKFSTVTVNLLGAFLYLLVAVQFVLVYFQNLSRGVEILILRLGIPFACIGLLNADKGVFKGYMQKFIKVAFTVIVQLTLLRLSIQLIANAHVIIAFAVSSMSLKTPSLLSEFLTTYGGTGEKASRIAHNLAVVGRAVGKKG